MNKSMRDRFFTHIDMKSQEDCWNWKASLNHKGYGQFKVNGVVLGAHRVAYELEHGTIPKGLQILHKCDNRKCVNPNHLYAGTAGDNITDREKRNPVDRAICGVTHTKFTAAEIQEIRKLKGTMTQRAAASIYKVTHFTIRMIWTKDKFLCKEGYYA